MDKNTIATLVLGVEFVEMSKSSMSTEEYIERLDAEPLWIEKAVRGLLRALKNMLAAHVKPEQDITGINRNQATN